MGCSSCEPKTLTVEQMKNMSSEQIIAAYRQGYKIVQGEVSQQQAMSQDWQYGGQRSIKVLASCGAYTKGSGETISLAASPNGGVGPYAVRFWRKSVAGAYTQVGATQPAVAEGSTATQAIALVDADISGATGDATAGTPTTGTSGAIIDPEDSTAALAAANIRVATTIVDSCPTPAGPAYCVSWCDVALACVPPTCGFVVS